MLKEKVIYITYIKMIQYGCVILDKSFFFADVSSPIDYQYVCRISVIECL